MEKRRSILSLGLVLAAFLLPQSAGCTTELRDGVLSGASSFAADATYGLLAEFLPFPLASVPGGGGNDDPFTDQPLQE